MMPSPLLGGKQSPRRSSELGRGFKAMARSSHPRLLPRPSLLLCVVLYFTVIAYAQRDPVANFCRRFGHQTALVDRKIYIDGGFINYNPLSSNPTNYTNTFLSYQDLDVNGAGNMPQLYANLSKNATIPSVNGGILWADDVNKKFYLFGGEYYQTPPIDLSLYTYDVINDFWEAPLDTPQSISGVSYGAGLSVSEKGEAYYYGGWLSNNSVPGWAGSKRATNGLVKYVMDTNSWTNITGPDSIGRAEGVMVYIPASDAGMLIYFGGIQDYGNGTVVGQPMDQIFIFDMLSTRWYQQEASGDVPGMRGRFCAGATWSEDQSSYNVYLYGGAGMAPNTAGWDDVYILSMPSFTWIKMYPSNSTQQQYPHNTLTCNVIDRAQMIVIGGTFPLDDTTCDAPDQYGSHGLDLGEQNPDGVPWYVYRSNLTAYEVPSLITSVIGGNAQGSATQTSPTEGFDSPDLKILMSRKYTAPVRQPTRDVSASGKPSPARPLSTGAIVGIAVGGAVVLIALLAGCWLCIRRQRRREKQERGYGYGRASGGGGGSSNGGGGGRRGHPRNGSYNHSSGSIGPGGPWSPGSSHHTPVGPYPSHSPFLPHAAIPRFPVEMPGNETSADEYPTSLHSPARSASVGHHYHHRAESGGGGSPGVMTMMPAPLSLSHEQKYDVDGAADGGGSWPGIVEARYLRAGFPPSELDTERSRVVEIRGESPRRDQHYRR
ncbi:hypothetical protein BX600DRAFT_213271 [Xylariales sp. PMI_506]|nr:hypothetical protein BX600DRAFT_213271 [Xylariales sp. PMI_506]